MSAQPLVRLSSRNNLTNNQAIELYQKIAKLL